MFDDFSTKSCYTKEKILKKAGKDAMQIRQLEYVRSIAENRSISRAAQKLFISQQALSETLKLLEQELGFQIFKRSNKGVVPTAAGEKFLRDLERILPVIDSWKQLAENVQHRENVKVLVQYLLSDLLVNETLGERLRNVTHVDIEWETDNAKQVIDLVEQKRFHIGLLHLFQDSEICLRLEQRKDSSELIVKKLMDSRMAIALRAEDALACKSVLTLTDLQERAMVQNRAFGEKSDIMQQLVRGIGIEKYFLPQSVNVLEYVLQHENTISYLPEFILKSNIHVQNGKLVVCYLEDDLACGLYVIYYKTDVSQALVTELETYFLR